jgi:uncharacterized protein with PQ loop repeat
MNPVEILGFIGGGLGVFVGVPQALQVRKLGHGKGVSLSAWTLMYAMYFAWAFYGIRIESPSAVISNIITVMVVSSVIYVLIDNPARAILSLFIIAVLVGLVILNFPEPVVSGILIASVFSQLPQVRKSIANFRGNIESAVSTHALQIGITSVLFWIAYAIIQRIWLMLLTSAISITMSSLILFYETRKRGVSVEI